MTTTNKNATGPAKSGLALSGHAALADLHGAGTLLVSETPEIVAERYRLKLEVDRLERRLKEIDECLKRNTGERRVGDFWVNVLSFTTVRLDADAAKEILQDAAPMIHGVSVRLTVKPA